MFRPTLGDAMRTGQFGRHCPGCHTELDDSTAVDEYTVEVTCPECNSEWHLTELLTWRASVVVRLRERVRAAQEAEAEAEAAGQRLVGVIGA